jgi:hypothetical protein
MRLAYTGGFSLIYSSDDHENTGLGWYWEDWHFFHSQSFDSKEEALAAKSDGKLIWRD